MPICGFDLYNCSLKCARKDSHDYSLLHITLELKSDHSDQLTVFGDVTFGITVYIYLRIYNTATLPVLKTQKNLRPGGVLE